MTLCPSCSRFDVRKLLRPPDDEKSSTHMHEADYYWDDQDAVYCFRHANDIRALESQASAGCELCALIIPSFPPVDCRIAQAIPIVLHRSRGFQIKAAFAHPDDRLGWQCELELSISPRKESSEAALFTSSRVKGIASIVSKYQEPFPPLKICGDAASAECLSVAVGWLSECLQSHKCGRIGNEKPPSTLRLLNVGDVKIDPHLEVFEESRPQQWAALSYCWGDVEPRQKLTDSTIESLKEGIPLLEFDATVRDAVLVTRALKITYIWIDALCIFQGDDRTDWSTQSAEMASIYGNSTVTIIPLHSKTVQQGFLTKRKLHYIRLRAANSGITASSASEEGLYISRAWGPEQDNIQGPWTERAWTMQEGLLPNRQLFFTSSQMIWKCCETVIFERGERNDFLDADPEDAIEDVFSSLDPFSQFRILKWVIKSSRSQATKQSYDLWHRFVEDYSKRYITKVRDRLIAISGLAAEFADTIGDQSYYAGLWRGNMLCGLLWQVSGSPFDPIKPAQGSPTGENPPSWSWASMDPGVSITYYSLKQAEFWYYATIEHVVVDPINAMNRFGAVASGGKITINAPILHMDRLYFSDWESSTAHMTAFERHISKLVERECPDRRAEISTPGHYVALLMLQTTDCETCHILILKEAKILPKQIVPPFRRVGAFAVKHRSQEDKMSQSLRDVRERGRASVRGQLRPPGSSRIEAYVDGGAVFEELRSCARRSFFLPQTSDS